MESEYDNNDIIYLKMEGIVEPFRKRVNYAMIPIEHLAKVQKIYLKSRVGEYMRAKSTLGIDLGLCKTIKKPTKGTSVKARIQTSN